MPVHMGTATAANLNGQRSGRFQAAAYWSAIAAAVVLGVCLYSTILPDLATEWWTEDASSYGLLVPPIALYIAYYRRTQTLAVPAQPDVRGLWLTATACCLLLGGELAA